MINVLIVEDQRITQEYIIDFLKKSEKYNLVGAISNAANAELFCSIHNVDLVLMDVCTEFDENGIEATSKLKGLFPDLKIIIMTSMVECSFIEKSKNSKADSFWYKDNTIESLLEVMDRTMEGENIFPEKTPEVQIGLTTSYDFTKTELKVLRQVVNGLTYEEIAEKLNIKVPTVRYHITNMLSKTGYSNKTRLAIAVTNKKLILPEFDKEFE